MSPAVPIAASSAPSLDLDPSIATWGVLGALVAGMLAIDLLVFARDHTPRMREAAAWSVVWLVVAVAFGAAVLGLAGRRGRRPVLRRLPARAHAVARQRLRLRGDPRRTSRCPPPCSRRCSRGASRWRSCCGSCSSSPARRCSTRSTPPSTSSARVLLFTAWKLVRREGQEVAPERNRALRLLPRRLRAKPLVVVFVVVATTDLVFAIDSIPAIFAVTSEPFVVFAANAFAVLGLRALYFLLAGMMDRFVYLSHGLALILAVIGAKMLLIDVWHPPIWLSLGGHRCRARRDRRALAAQRSPKGARRDAPRADRGGLRAGRRVVVVRPPDALDHRGQRGDARPGDLRVDRRRDRRRAAPRQRRHPRALRRRAGRCAWPPTPIARATSSAAAGTSSTSSSSRRASCRACARTRRCCGSCGCCGSCARCGCCRTCACSPSRSAARSPASRAWPRSPCCSSTSTG